MVYYNRQHEKFEPVDMKYLDKGECAEVFCDGKMIFKKYFSNTAPDCRLTIRMFDTLRSINNPHLIELFDVYKGFTSLQLLENKFNPSSFSIDAYKARYYPDDSVNILYESKDYILDNFEELELLFEIFTECSVCTRDVKRGNTILSKEGIIIIDPDLFDNMRTSKKYISKINKHELLNLFSSIFRNAALNTFAHDRVRTFLFDEIDKINVTSNTDVTYEISKKLKYVKKPIELFKR